ncbi:hypothetical protein [Crocosphaera sp.]|uniref:hypothetical protein n=1 Tax=Crocosphaera sp. TaxID=2729996 RepID=UPI002630225E|nr:hypothetical protein [Crocosphaera sp.]MDJ0580893.1 hypothetical protein [Crocosphaera sp.]
MYEDFNYITDDNFLRNYWRQEKVICQKCRGKGKLRVKGNENMFSCSLCENTGKVHRYKQNKVSAA